MFTSWVQTLMGLSVYLYNVPLKTGDMLKPLAPIGDLPVYFSLLDYGLSGKYRMTALWKRKVSSELKTKIHFCMLYNDFIMKYLKKIPQLSSHMHSFVRRVSHIFFYWKRLWECTCVQN